MTADPRLTEYTADILLERLAAGAIRAAEIGESAIRRLERDGSHGLAWFDADYARRQAAALDNWRLRRRPLGALHGLPVTVSDLVDTARIPTARGFPADQGRLPERDAPLFALLRNTGAQLVGKAAVPPFGVGGTDRQAVALVARRCASATVMIDCDAGTVAHAAATGAVGYRPTPGNIPLRGSFSAVPSLDAAAVVAADLSCAARLAEALFSSDGQDPVALSPHPRLAATMASPPPVVPTLAFVPPRWWREADPLVHAALDELQAFLGERTFEAKLPEIFGEAVPQARRVIAAETAKSLHGTQARHRDSLTAPVLDLIDLGETVSARHYLTALDWRTVLRAGLDAVFERCDAIVTAASRLPGDCDADDALVWSFVGLPVVTLPLLAGDDGAPIGVALIGRCGEDARLLRTARWLQDSVSQGGVTS